MNKEMAGYNNGRDGKDEKTTGNSGKTLRQLAKPWRYDSFTHRENTLLVPSLKHCHWMGMGKHAFSVVAPVLLSTLLHEVW